MRDTTERLGKVRASDPAQAFAVIGEAVWWVTIVDATLVRYYPDEYDAALAGLPARQRRRPRPRSAACASCGTGWAITPITPTSSSRGAARRHRDAPITEWTWRSLPAPAVATLPPRGQEWELSRYRAYQDVLAGRPIGETFDRTAAFLVLASRDVERPRGMPGTRGGRPVASAARR